MAFLSVSPFDAAHPKAIAIYCSDGRFTNPVEELLHSLGHPRLDVVAMPGGPALFNPWRAGLSDSMAMSGGSRFLIDAHGIEQAILLAHEGCGFYKKHMPHVSAAEVREAQENDLRHAMREIASTCPHVKVLLYYASVEKDHVRFLPVK